MSTNNFYPELPEIPYQKTAVEMPDVVIFAKSLIGKYSKEVVRMAYAVFRFESANGTKGVNHNYAGIQADNARWKGLPGNPVATCVKRDNGGNVRRFLCFDKDTGYKISFELICIKATERKMITALDYEQKWVGVKNPTPEALTAFSNVLKQSVSVFP